MNIRQTARTLALLGAAAWLGPAQAATGSLFAPQIDAPTQVGSNGMASIHYHFRDPTGQLAAAPLLVHHQWWICPAGNDQAPPTAVSLDVAANAEPFPGGAPVMCVAHTRPAQPVQGAHENAAHTQTSAYLGNWQMNEGDGTYYVRARLETANPAVHGPWGPWHRIVAGTMHFKDAPIARPQLIGPPEGRLFVNQSVPLQVRSRIKHPNAGNWKYDIEWRRARYHTKHDNDSYDAAHGGHTQENMMRRVIGLVEPLRPWNEAGPAVPREAAEMPGTQTITVPFSALRSQEPYSSFEYSVRVREHRISPDMAGLWTPWREFIVQAPYQFRAMPFIHSSGQAGSQQLQRRGFMPKTGSGQ